MIPSRILILGLQPYHSSYWHSSYQQAYHLAVCIKCVIENPSNHTYLIPFSKCLCILSVPGSHGSYTVMITLPIVPVAHCGFKFPQSLPQMTILLYI